MRRGKVVLKRIENKKNRRVAFSKRKNGLMNKAIELSVLCGADVAVIVFSNTGKLFEFGTTDMNNILERYQQQCYISGRSSTNRDEYAMQIEEVSKLRTKYESLQRSYSNFHGEKLESLNLKELDELEKKLGRILSQTRELESEMMLKKIGDLRKMEQDLAHLNAKLKSQLKSQIKGGKQGMQQSDDGLGDSNMSSRYRYFDINVEDDDGSRE